MLKNFQILMPLIIWGGFLFGKYEVSAVNQDQSSKKATEMQSMHLKTSNDQRLIKPIRLCGNTSSDLF